MKPAAMMTMSNCEQLEGLLGDFSGPACDERVEAAERALRVRFPWAYRRFLELHGAGRLGNVDVFGLPSDWLWGDIVMMNELAPVKAPERCILIARDLRGNFYYMSTARGEADLVFRLSLDERATFVAPSFLSFLELIRKGLI